MVSDATSTHQVGKSPTSSCIEHETDGAGVVFWGLGFVEVVELVADGATVSVAIKGSSVLAKFSVVGNWRFPSRVGQVEAI